MGFNNAIDAAIYIFAFIILAAAAFIDIRKRIIPDRLILAGAAAGIILKICDTENGLLDGLIGGITAGLILLAVCQVTKGGLGLGDVKLFGCIGIYLGFENTVSAMLMSAILSGLFSLLLICRDRNNAKREIPFAPFILAGTLAAVIFGEVL